MSTFRAARVEQKIMKVPKHEVVIALVLSEYAVAITLNLEQDLTIHQNGKELDACKTSLAAEPFD